MSRLTLALLAAALAASAAPVPETATATAGVTAAAAQETPAAAPAPPAGSGLPQYAPPPRTMHDHWPVFAAFALSFLGIAGYLVTLGRRMGRVSARAARGGAGRP